MREEVGFRDVPRMFLGKQNTVLSPAVKFKNEPYMVVLHKAKNLMAILQHSFFEVSKGTILKRRFFKNYIFNIYGNVSR